MLLVGGGIVGGVESHVLSLVAAFSARGLAPIVVAPFVGDFTQALVDQGHPPEDLEVLEMSDRVDIAALAHLIWLCESRGITVVHSHMRPADLLAAPAAYHAGLPAVSSLHGLLRYKEELLLSQLYGQRFIAVSEAGRQSALEIGVPAAHVQVVRNGIDPVRFDPTRLKREVARQQLGLDQSALIVAAVVRLMPEKDPMAIVEVARRVTAVRSGVDFVVAGTGVLESQVRQATASMPHVRLLGSYPDVPQLLAASDVVLLTSKRESLPLAVLEAMAMELPVVAYDVGGVGEALTETTGCLIPPGDLERMTGALVALLDDPRRRAVLGREGRRRVLAHFTHERCAAGILERYRALESPVKRTGALLRPTGRPVRAARASVPS